MNLKLILRSKKRKHRGYFGAFERREKNFGIKIKRTNGIIKNHFGKCLMIVLNLVN